MIEKGKISARQLSVIVIMFTVGSSILNIPSPLAQEAKQDAWIAAICGLLGGLLLVVLYNKLASRFPNMTLVQYSQEVLGKWLGRSIAFLYFTFFLLIASLVLRSMGDFLTTEILPNTPIHMIHILFLLVIIMGLRHGIEVLCRSAEIFIPWIFFFFVVLVPLLLPQFKFDYIQPIFGYGIKPILHGTSAILSTPYMELVTFLMLFPFVNHSQKARKAFLVGVSIAGCILIISSLLTILVLGAELTARLQHPIYSMVQKVSIGHFLERLEVIIAGIWFITIYVKLAICFYAATMTFAELFKLKEARQLYLPFGMILIVLSIIVYPNTTFVSYFREHTFFLYIFPYAVIFPLLILIVAIIRKKKAN